MLGTCLLKTCSQNWGVAVNRRRRLRQLVRSDSSFWASFLALRELPLLNQEYYSYTGYVNSVDVKGSDRPHSRKWKKDFPICS
jgi:hypothetical protein